MKTLNGAVLGLLAGLTACQNYDFHYIPTTPVQVISEQVTFAADAGTAYIMIVQDTSGSMCQPITTGVQTDSNGCAHDSSKSKLSLVAQDFTDVLEGLDGGGFYIGLTAFPEDNACTPPTTSVYPIAAAATNIPKIIQWYGDAGPHGGTPTAASLTQGGSDPALAHPAAGSSLYMILLTDGYPNCNPSNPCAVDPSQNLWSDGVGHGCESQTYEQQQNGNAATPPPQCQCGNGPCTDPTNPQAPDCCFIDQAAQGAPTMDDSYNCLDNLATDAVLSQLHSTKGIKTFVVGIGSSFSNYTVLDAMAQAGSGLPDAGAYRAEDETTLAAAIQAIIGSVAVSCSFALDGTPADPKLIQVTLNGANLTLGDATNGFTYDPPPANTVNLGTVACADVKSGRGTVSVTALGQP